MSRARRSVFTAPLVIVVATSGCGSKGEQPAAGSGSASGSTAGSGSGPTSAANRIAWTIDRVSREECLARQDDCPPGKDCNPPPPIRFRCPPEAPAADTFTITTTAAGDTCYLGTSMTVVPCPYAAPLPPPVIDAGTDVAATEPHHRRWAVLRQGKACQAAEDTCQLRGAPGQPVPPCNPPPPTKLAACPPPDITAIVERAAGECVQVHEPTLGPVGEPVPCPPVTFRTMLPSLTPIDREAVTPALTSADREQVELMRLATPEQRFALARSLSAQTLAMTHHAIDRANPQLDLWQRRVKFVEVQYGAELAAGYRRWLAARGLIAP